MCDEGDISVKQKWMLEMYKIAEGRIGEYDTHVLRCKQWLTAIVSACIIAAYSRHDLWGWVLLGGMVMGVIVFVVEMSYRTVAKRLVDYCRCLESEGFPTGGKKSCRKHMFVPEDWRLSHAISPSTRVAWRQFRVAVWGGLWRPNVIVPYLASVAILVVGVTLAARL